jgi:hypothetical protein
MGRLYDVMGPARERAASADRPMDFGYASTALHNSTRKPLQSRTYDTVWP